MAKFLHIESSTKVCSIALSENGQLTAIKEESKENYIHAEKLTVFIDEILKKKAWQFSDLNAIVVTSGPGSYTGLRIGVSVAKGLCYALSLPLIAVDSIAGIAQIAQKKYPTKNICAMIDARRMEVFSAIYNDKSECIKSLSSDELTTDSYVKYEPFVVCGDATGKVKELWKNRQLIFDESIQSSAKGQIEIAFQKYKDQNFEDVAYFEPKYLKDFIATKSSKKLF